MMKERTKRISVFRFGNYRDFLKAWYEHEKLASRGFSFRAFSKRAGFSSPNFYKLVMDGERNLTEKSLAKFCIGLKLNKQEQEFFRNLVFFNQAKTQTEKNLYYKKLVGSKKLRQLKPMSKKQYQFYSQWYHPVIRELLVADSSDGTAKWVAENIFQELAKMKPKNQYNFWKL